MKIPRNTSAPRMTARLDAARHLVGRSLGNQQHSPGKQQSSKRHSIFSAIVIVGFMIVGTIFVISLLQLLVATVD